MCKASGDSYDAVTGFFSSVAEVGAVGDVRAVSVVPLVSVVLREPAPPFAAAGDFAEDGDRASGLATVSVPVTPAS